MSSFLNPPFILAILFALSVHEAAHAWAAWKLGDSTAKMEGRLTLNPLAHLDPMGTILFLLVGFGWGKPVPVNAYYFRKPKRDSALTALAGPVSNLVMAIVVYVLMLVMFGTPGDSLSILNVPASASFATTFFHQFLASSLFLNLGLMAFNLLPVAPLDGSKVLQAFIPLSFEEQYDNYLRYGPYILLGVLIAERFVNISILSWWITGIMDAVLMAFTSVTHLVGF